VLAYINAHTCTNKHTHYTYNTHLYVHTQTHTIHTYLHACTQTHAHAHTHTPYITHLPVHTYIHIYTLIHINTYTHYNTRLHVHTYTMHMYTQYTCMCAYTHSVLLVNNNYSSFLATPESKLTEYDNIEYILYKILKLDLYFKIFCSQILMIPIPTSSMYCT